jgi:hypothetical protein
MWSILLIKIFKWGLGHMYKTNTAWGRRTNIKELILKLITSKRNQDIQTPAKEPDLDLVNLPTLNVKWIHLNAINDVVINENHSVANILHSCSEWVKWRSKLVFFKARTGGFHRHKAWSGLTNQFDHESGLLFTVKKKKKQKSYPTNS